MHVGQYFNAMLGKPVLVLWILATSSSCNFPHALPGEGKSLRLHIVEEESGQIHFSRTAGKIEYSNCEMECEFTNNRTMRVPCVFREILVENSTGPIVATGSLSHQVLVPSAKPSSQKSKQALLGAFDLPKPHPGWISTFEAIFPTVELPLRFRIIFKDHSTPFFPVRMQTK